MTTAVVITYDFWQWWRLIYWCSCCSFSSCSFSRSTTAAAAATTTTTTTTVDQFNKKRVLLLQTLDISYSGVHGNKKFPTVEGPEVVRQGKRADVAWAGVEASRKFYFGILNFPVPESM